MNNFCFHVDKKIVEHLMLFLRNFNFINILKITYDYIAANCTEKF